MPTREEYQQLKASGTCVNCFARPAADGRVRCGRCIARVRSYDKAHYAKLRAKGLCGHSCGQPIDEGRSGHYCRACLDEMNARHNRLYAERLAQGRCRSCSAPAVEGRVRCLQHLVEAREWARDYRAGLRRIA